MHGRLLLIGLWLFLSRRGALAAAIRVHDSNRRLRRFKIAGVLALVTGLALVSYFWDLRDDEISTASLLLHNLVGNSAMIGAIVFTILGVLTRRDQQPQMIGA
jgi:membrane protease YdiL (CAAX protease family)